jgi:hypothetical protein
MMTTMKRMTRTMMTNKGWLCSARTTAASTYACGAQVNTGYARVAQVTQAGILPALLCVVTALRPAWCMQLLHHRAAEGG